jgi:hypothetical protein
MKFENKKWVLRVALAGALSLGVATVAKADSRLDSLGTDSYQIDDVDSIWSYANNILQYKNTVDFRLNSDGNGTALGGGTKEWGGVIHDLGDDFGTIATYVNRPSAISNSQKGLIGSALPLFNNPTQTVGSATNVYAPSDNVDIFWAKSGLGLHLSYGDNEAVGGTVRSQVWGLAAGFDLGSFLSFQTSEFHVDIAEDFLTNNAPKPVTDDGVYTFKLGWEGQTTLNPNDSSHVFINLQYDNDSLPANFNGVGQANNDLEALIGGNIKHNISDKGFVNTGLEFEYDGINGSTNAGTDAWTLVWNASVESALNSFLTARAGLDKVVFNRTYTTGTPSQVDSSLVAGLNNNVAFNFGLSATAENWTLDTNLTMASVEGTLTGPTPGQGIFYGTGAGIYTAGEADLRYKF